MIGTVGRVPGRPVFRRVANIGILQGFCRNRRDEERSSRDQRDESVTFSPQSSLGSLITGPGCPPGVFLLVADMCMTREKEEYEYRVELYVLTITLYIQFCSCVIVCARVSRVCPGSPRCLFIGSVSTIYR